MNARAVKGHVVSSGVVPTYAPCGAYVGRLDPRAVARIENVRYVIEQSWRRIKDMGFFHGHWHHLSGIRLCRKSFVRSDAPGKQILPAARLPNFVGLWQTGYPMQVHSARNIFSIFRPFANSSTNLSRYLTFCVNGFSISSTR